MMLSFSEPTAKELSATRAAGKIQQKCQGLNNRHRLILPAKLLLKCLNGKNCKDSDFTQSNIKNKHKALSILAFQSLEYLRLWHYVITPSLVPKTVLG